MAVPALEIISLSVRFTAQPQDIAAVRDFSMRLLPGETLAIVGESGSGKSQAMLAALGLLAANGRASGSVRLEGEEILGLAPAALNAVRGRRVTLIFQEPMSALDPLFRIGQQIAAPLRAHAGMGRRAARARTLELLGEVGIANPRRAISAYPHQLSGGQRQRVMIAMAIACNPAVLIADEPTTALDATLQAQIMELLMALKTRLGMAIVLVTHDLGLVRRCADHALVMRAGEIVESGPARDVFANPQASYTRSLLAAAPPPMPLRADSGGPALLEAVDLSVTFRLSAGLFRRAHTITAVGGVSLTLRRGETLGIVGESGSGKTTLGRALLRLVPAKGALLYKGADLMPLSRAAMRPLRRALQIVFQDPYGSLSPRMSAGAIVGEGLRVHEPGLARSERDARVGAALEDAGLDPGLRSRFPHEFSGGQRQRIAIARALILRPEILVLDEPTSALDRVAQRDIVALLLALQQQHGLTYVFISHDLAVVRALADRVMVMQDGRIIEEGPAARVFSAPCHEITRRLIAAALTG